MVYAFDTPYNCFPSIHVGHSFVSALVCYRVDRRVGFTALIVATLVGLSTLFIKQHYAVRCHGLDDLRDIVAPLEQRV